MKKSYIQLAALLSMVGFADSQARTIETPIPFTYGLPMPHYPIKYSLDAEKPYSDNCGCWNFDFMAFGGAYYRNANDAYGNCDGTSKTSLAQLIFGAPSFTLSQAFPNAVVDVPTNPFVSISTITPVFGWSEQGAVFIAELASKFEYCDTEYRVGLRARLPVRDIEVRNVCGLDIFEGDITDISDVYQTREEVIGTGTFEDPQETNTVYAARLDFLSAINAIAAPVPQEMVNYNNVGNRITIDEINIDISDANFADMTTPNLQNIPPVAAIYRANGSVPSDQTWGLHKSSITGKVLADGSGLAQNERGRFDTALDYSGAAPKLEGNIPAQSKLWIVPTIQANNVGGNVNQLTQGAFDIGAAIALAIGEFNGTNIDFIEELGLGFCDGRTKGLGDLQLELYAGRDWGCDQQFWTDLLFGVSIPTSDDLCSCLTVLKQPLGNDGHTELYGALYAGWDAYSWMKFMADLTVGGALSDRESIAAPFEGATIRNIGPCINADIKWWYLVGHFDISFFASDCCGFDLGYEIYHKGCDKVSLCATTATDFLGNVDQPLDASVITRGTERTSHKIRVGFFTIVGDCEIFGGWSQIVAGKNIPRETDWYVSMAVSF